VTQSGLLTPEAVKRGMIATFSLAGAVCLYLIAVAGWPVLLVGVLAILSALGYSGGPYPLASHGLGDLFVFLFFGPVAVCGTYFVQALTLTGTVVIWAIPPGLLIAAILVVNNLRDRDTDREAGKRTLAVIIGPRGTRMEYTLLILLAYAFPPAMLAGGAASPFILLPLLTLPFGGRCIRRIYRETGRVLNVRLGATAMLSLWFSLLLAIGIAVA
jgi:1,4-dihydroxy-2-naphthoate octaprenyltransferase